MSRAHWPGCLGIDDGVRRGHSRRSHDGSHLRRRMVDSPQPWATYSAGFEIGGAGKLRSSAKVSSAAHPARGAEACREGEALSGAEAFLASAAGGITVVCPRTDGTLVRRKGRGCRPGCSAGEPSLGCPQFHSGESCWFWIWPIGRHRAGLPPRGKARAGGGLGSGRLLLQRVVGPDGVSSVRQASIVACASAMVRNQWSPAGCTVRRRSAL